MSLLKSLMVAAVAITLPGVASAAVIYDLTLTDASNPAYSGTGVLVLNVAAPATGPQVDYTNAQVAKLTFTIDGQTFTYGGPGSSLTAVRFDNGQFNDISFGQEIGPPANRYALHTTAGYDFYYNNEQSLAVGTITSTLASAVPEPSTWAMMVAGLGVLGAVLRRRKMSRPAEKSVTGIA